MIHQILKFSTVILLFAFISTGCQKDDVFELRAGDKNAVIVKEVDGIEFKFCLLNEQGEPATVFNEGENFTFSFSIKNNLDDYIYFDTSVFNVTGFFEVKNESGNFGIPYKKPTFDNLRIPEKITKGEIYGANIKWIPDNTELHLGVTNFFKSPTENLNKGTYYTEFSHGFNFKRIKTDKLTFKINFKIK